MPTKPTDYKEMCVYAIIRGLKEAGEEIAAQEIRLNVIAHVKAKEVAKLRSKLNSLIKALENSNGGKNSSRRIERRREAEAPVR